MTETVIINNKHPELVCLVERLVNKGWRGNFAGGYVIWSTSPNISKYYTFDMDVWKEKPFKSKEEFIAEYFVDLL